MSNIDIAILKDHAERLDALVKVCRLQQEQINDLKEMLKIISAQLKTYRP